LPRTIRLEPAQRPADGHRPHRVLIAVGPRHARWRSTPWRPHASSAAAFPASSPGSLIFALGADRHLPSSAGGGRESWLATC
jgi:hypothetical protein